MDTEPTARPVPCAFEDEDVRADTAVANAARHATGVRVRDLPVTPDRVLPALPSDPS